MNWPKKQRLSTHLRKIVANHCSVRENEIIFTRGTTEALNLLAHSFGRAQLNSGDVIALTEMEHHANIVPWQIIGKELGTTIEVIPILPDGSLDRDFLSNVLKQKRFAFFRSACPSPILSAQ